MRFRDLLRVTVDTFDLISGSHWLFLSHQAPKWIIILSNMGAIRSLIHSFILSYEIKNNISLGRPLKLTHCTFNLYTNLVLVLLLLLYNAISFQIPACDITTLTFFRLRESVIPHPSVTRPSRARSDEIIRRIRGWSSKCVCAGRGLLYITASSRKLMMSADD